MAKKLNRNAENILKMLKSTAPEDMAKWIDVILNDLASTVDNRAVAEFIYRDEKGMYLASSCYVTPPAKGEYVIIRETEYEVIKVIHVFDRSHQAGTIILKEVGKYIEYID